VYLLKYNPIYELIKLRTKTWNKNKLYTTFVNFSLIKKKKSGIYGD